MTPLNVFGDAWSFFSQISFASPGRMAILVVIPLLVAAYLLAFRFTRWHWIEVAHVIELGTESLRRAFYFRTLALTHTVAKEIRVFGLDRWLVDRYRSSWTEVTPSSLRCSITVG